MFCFFSFCETWTLRREAHGLDEIFLAKQQHEKETQELEEEIEAVHRRVRYGCYGMFCFLVRDTGTTVQMYVELDGLVTKYEAIPCVVSSLSF